MTMPTQTRYDALLAALRKLKKSYDGAKNDKARLDIGIEAFREVILYLQADADVRAEGLTRPLGLIENAVYDAGRGAKPPLLNHPPEGSKPTGITQESVQAALAWAVELMVRAGEMKAAAAVKWVAAEGRRVGLSDPSGGAVDSKQIIQWRKNLRAGRATAGAAREWEQAQRHAADIALLKMPMSDLRRVRAQQSARAWILCVSNIAPRSAPTPRSP
jgi:hypothetical protein